MSLARSFLSDPHGMIFIHASCDQPLMNSPITKLKFCHSERSEESNNIFHNAQLTLISSRSHVILNAVKNLKDISLCSI